MSKATITTICIAFGLAAEAATLSISATNQYHFVPPVTTNLCGKGMGETADYRVMRYEDVAFLKEAFAERRHVLGLDWYWYWPERRFEDGRWNSLIPASEGGRYVGDYDWDYTHPEAVEAYFTEYFYDAASLATNNTPRGKTPSFVTMSWGNAFSPNTIDVQSDYRIAGYDPKTDYFAILSASASSERLLANGSIVTNATRALGTVTNPGGSSLLIRGGIPSLAAITNAYRNLGLMSRWYVIPPSGESYTNYRMTVWHSMRERHETGVPRFTFERDGDYAISYPTSIVQDYSGSTNETYRTDTYGRLELPSTTFSYTSRTRIYMTERIYANAGHDGDRYTFYRVSKPNGRVGLDAGTTFERTLIHPLGQYSSGEMSVYFPIVTTNIARRMNFLSVWPVVGIAVRKRVKRYARAANDALEPQRFGDIVKTYESTTNHYVVVGREQLLPRPSLYVKKAENGLSQYDLAVWDLDGAGRALLTVIEKEGDSDIMSYTPADYDPNADIAREYPQTATGIYRPDGTHYNAFPTYVDGIVEETREYAVEWLRYVCVANYDFNAKVITP